MSEETIEDIIAEMRSYPTGLRLDECQEFCDRIEAALKRERAAFDCECAGIAELAAKEEAARHKPGNAAAMREALLRCEAISQLPEVRNEQSIKDMRNIIKHALSAPPRQCDVGTEEEHGLRYNAWCRKHFTPDALGGNCRKCQLKDRRGWSCQLAWAQTPYAAQEGAAK